MSIHIQSINAMVEEIYHYILTHNVVSGPPIGQDLILMRGAIDSGCKTAANILNKQPSKPYVETLIDKLELMVVNPVSDSLTKAAHLAELYMYYWYTAVIDK